MKNKIIQIKHLTRKEKNNLILDDLNFDLLENEILSIVGPVEVSLIPKCILKLIEYKGKIDIYSNSASFLYNLEFIGYYSLTKDLPKNMKIKDFIKFSNSFYKNNYLKNYESYLKRYNLDLEKKIIDLSDIEYEVLKLIDSLFINPSILILDHPFTKIDDQTKKLLIDDLLSLKQKGSSILIIDNEFKDMKFADRILVYKYSTLLTLDTTNENINLNDLDLTHVTREILK